MRREAATSAEPSAPTGVAGAARGADAPRTPATLSWAAVPLVPLAVAFGLGIAIAPWLPARAAWGLWIAGALIAAATLFTRWVALGGIALLAAVVALGALRGAPAPLAADHVARLLLPTQADLVGHIAAPPAPSPGRLRVLVDVDTVDGERRSGRVQLTVYGDRARSDAPPSTTGGDDAVRERGDDDVTVGQRVRVQARLQTPTGFRNPGGFDYVARLARDGIHVTGSARAEQLVALDAPRVPWNERVKRRAVAAMDEALPPASAALLAGLLLGERRELPPEIDDGFRRAGVYHVLAVSGFNVALVASAMFFVTRFVGLGRRVAAVAAAVVVVGFGAVVGPQASVLRAVVMALLVLAAMLLDRETAVVNSLAAAALVILAVRPTDLFDPGFQLSFAATAGIVLAPQPRSLILGAIAVSAAAQAAVLPITLWHFHQVSVVGVIANLAVVPLATIATIVGLAGAALAFAWSAAAQLAFDAVWPILLALRAVVALAAAMPGALVYFPAPPASAVALYAGALVAAALAWRVRRASRTSATDAAAPHVPLARGLAAYAAIALVVSLALAAWPIVRPGDGRLRVAVLDVGQGDALVVEGPNRAAVVIDAGPGGGGRLDAGERVVAPYLWWRGLLRVTATVVTHDHADHTGGMDAVRTRFGNVPVWTAVDFATPRTLGGAVIAALPAIAGTTPNERALVLRVDYGATSFLLASDIPGTVERALVASGATLDATVLKVAHHGARESSTTPFVDAVHPTIAAVSVGARNPYRHPHREALERLRAAGARVLRTDRDGALLFETDGRVLEVTTWATGARERWCVDPEAVC